MKVAEANPPPLPTRTRTRSGWGAGSSLALLLGLMLLARFALHFQLPLPSCPLLATTGVPCPLCGSTRAFASMSRFDFTEALRLNPLVSLITCCAVVTWLLVLLHGSEWWSRRRELFTTNAAWKLVVAGAVFVNWLYLLRNLPR